MTRRAAIFRESDIVRAVKAARKAGLRIAGIACRPDGTIEVRHGAPLDAHAHEGDASLDDIIQRTLRNGEARRGH